MNSTQSGSQASSRGSWSSRTGFILAAAGSAVGLGNIWRFPYITGENGGGLFVVIYLLAILFVGLPVMIAEIMIGRAAQRSNVGAFKRLDSEHSPWRFVGGAGVVVGFAFLSFYAVVGGWAMHYLGLALRGGIAGRSTEEIQALFGSTYTSVPGNLIWTALFILATMLVVGRGVSKGLERWSRILMPSLLALLVVLLVRGMTLDGFSEAFGFVFGLNSSALTRAGVFEAVGHAFATLSLGMGGLLTYGSYLSKEADIPKLSLSVAALDTAVALLACLVIFPIMFSAGLEPAAGPGLVFTSVPLAFSQMPFGAVLAVVFFALLVFAALTSSISLLEVASSYFIDERSWSRTKATLFSGTSIALLAVPSALTGSSSLLSTKMEAAIGKSWFDLIVDTSSNWALPIGGMAIALFVSWRVPKQLREREFFAGGGRSMGLYRLWLGTLRFFVPAAILAVILHVVGVI